MMDTTIATVNAAGKAEKQPEGISFADLDGTVRLEDYDFSNEQHEVIQNEEMDDNASDKSYEESEEEDTEDDLSYFSAESHCDPAKETEVENDPISDAESEDNNNDTDNDSNLIPSDVEEPDGSGSVDSGTIGDPEENSEPSGSDGETETKLPRMVYEISNHNSGGDYWQIDNSRTRSESIIGAMFAVGESILTVEATANKMLNDYFRMEASKATPQYGFRKGLKVFGDEGYDAAVCELKDNLLGRDCVRMLKGKEVTHTVRKKALSYLMFLKRKRSSRIKGRGVADGRPQREYISKEESSSPTVSLYALMASCVMDAIEERSVITWDLPAAFLQGEYPQEEG